MQLFIKLPLQATITKTFLKAVNWEIQIRRILNNCSEQRGFTHTCTMNPQWSISLFSRLYFAVNSFPEFENEKDCEIKLSLILTSFFLLRFTSF